MRAFWFILIIILFSSCASWRRTGTKHLQTAEQCTMSDVSILNTATDLVRLSNIRLHLNAVIFDNTDSVPRVAAVVDLTQQSTDSTHQNTVATSADSLTSSHNLTTDDHESNEVKVQQRSISVPILIVIIGGLIVAFFLKKKCILLGNI